MDKEPTYDELKQRVEALENEKKYTTLFEKAGDAIFFISAEMDDAGRILDANLSAARMHGYSIDELLTMTIGDLDTDDAAKDVPEKIARMLRGEWIKDDIMHRRKDGSVFPVEISAGMIEIAGKRCILAFDRDISDRARAEKELKESEARYRTIFEGAGEGLLLVDIETMVFEFANPAICVYLQYTAEELTCLKVTDIHPETSLDKVRNEFETLARGGKTLVEDVPCLRKDGTVVYADIRAGVIVLGGRKYMIGFYADITEQKKIRDALQEQLIFLQTLIDTIPSPIFYKDEHGRYLGCNSAFETFSGYKRESLIGKTVQEVAPEELADRYMAADKALLESGNVQIYEASVMYADGEKHDVVFNKAVFPKKDLTPGGIVGAMLDITDRKRAESEKKELESRLHQTQKLEAIGTLAGGIAHDFNNILAGILGYCELALQDVTGNTRMTGYLGKIIQAGQRARDLVRQILAFSQQSNQDERPVRVKFVISEALKLIRASLPSSIDIKARLISRADVFADPTQIHQIIMNLVTNAAHAMRESGGALSVTLDDVRIPDTEGRRYPDVEPGDYVRLRVEDTGYGIPPGVIDRIFEPFFTTKKAGEGTGMGLSVVHGIVKKQGGGIHVESRPGKGSVFEVILPVITGCATETKQETSETPRGVERILLVDDEPYQTETGKHLLERIGYRVTACTGSRQALELFRASPKDFDLVVTDFTMPHMGGDALSQAIHEIRPDVPVLLCTGFSDQLTDEKIKRAGIGGVVMKPFIFHDFASAIRRLLDES